VIPDGDAEFPGKFSELGFDFQGDGPRTKDSNPGAKRFDSRIG